MAKGVAIALALMVLAGCAAREQLRGDHVEEDRLVRVVPGVHTKNDVAAILGSPSTVAPFENDAWFYLSSQTETIAFLPTEEVARQVVIIRFDESDVVTEVESFGKERGHEVAFTDRQTPTFGTDLNAVEQFMSNLGRFNREEGQRR